MYIRFNNNNENGDSGLQLCPMSHFGLHWPSSSPIQFRFGLISLIGGPISMQFFALGWKLSPVVFYRLLTLQNTTWLSFQPNSSSWFKSAMLKTEPKDPKEPKEPKDPKEPTEEGTKLNAKSHRWWLCNFIHSSGLWCLNDISSVAGNLEFDE